MNNQPSPLTAEENQRLAELEPIIERGLGSFVEVGGALAEIARRKLYRATHGTFEEYCEQRWGFSRSYAYRLIKSMRVVKRLSPIGYKVTNEAQARELATLKPEMQTRVLDHLKLTERPVTAESIKIAAAELRGESSCDYLGNAVTSLAQAQEALKGAQEKNLLQTNFPLQPILDCLEKIHRRLMVERHPILNPEPGSQL